MVHLLGPEQQRSRQTVHGRVAPSLVVESAIFIQETEHVAVLLGTEEVHICYLEIRPEMAHVPQITVRVAITQQGKEVTERPGHGRCGHHGGPERCCRVVHERLVFGEFAEERRHRTTIFPKRNCVSVCFAVLCHFDKWIVCDGAGEGYIRFDAPVPLVRLESGVIVEETMRFMSGEIYFNMTVTTYPDWNLHMWW